MTNNKTRETQVYLLLNIPIEILTKIKLKRLLQVSFGLFLIYFIFCLPSPLFKEPYSKLLVDRNGELLEARIASDEQWRFPIMDSLPRKFEKCILRFEDKHFHNHPGINPIAIARAIYLNLRKGEVVSGASTITMQTIRLHRKNGKRTFGEKLIEMIWALRLECGYSKDQILNLHASHAPFGGNVVGLETASWRYFNRSPYQLSWAENAMLAVLPNAPGLIHLNKNREALTAKRNKLLAYLYKDETITQEEYKIAISEPLPNPINSLTHHAYHLVSRYKDTKGKIESTIELKWQKQFNKICGNYSEQMKQQNIHNLSAILMDVKTGEVLSYVGNIYKDNDEHAGKVDMLKSVRSSGSILKPFLYAASISEGLINPKQLMPDYPMNFYGYRPSNYNPQFDGLVPADEALYRSLNIPAAWLLSSYGITKMKSTFHHLGLTSVNRPAVNYGLSMILGGAEVNLLELTNSYAALAHQLSDTIKSNRYHSYLLKNRSLQEASAKISLDKGSIYSVYSALSNTYRPETESHWKNFSSGRKIAWKTGTSYGNRDAWAVGVTPEYAIGVWIGNSDGEGVSGLTGLNNAAPLLFQLYDLLPPTSWFYQPMDMKASSVCMVSGMKTNKYCPKTQETLLPAASDKTTNCKYHTPYLLNRDTYRVYKECSETETHYDTFFVLPPIVSHYFQKRHPDHVSVPRWDSNCISVSASINVLYPINNGKISLPKGEKEGIPAKVFYNENEMELYWELNGIYLGVTIDKHEMLLYPRIGKNALYITDENGNVVSTGFEVKE